MRCIPPVKPLLRVIAALAAFAATPASVPAADISHQEIGNVGPFAFSVVWQVSGPSQPALEIYADADGTVDASGQAVVEFFPLHAGDRNVASDFQGRADRVLLQDRLRSRNLVLVRVSGLAPGTDYYVRPKAMDGSGIDITSNGPLPLLEVRTALENAFVEESRQLVLDFNGGDPDAVGGAVARVLAPGLKYPLFAVVGDGSSPTEAFFNLDNLLDAAGLTNLIPANPLDLEINLLGMGVLQGVMQFTVPYGGGFVAAQAIVTPFAILADSFAFDPIAGQVTGAAFSVTIRALDFKGNLVETFAGTVDLSANLAISAGGGQTQAFSGGVLSGHNVTLSEPGEAQLSVIETGGQAAGTSNVFQVIEITWNLVTSVVPAVGGAVAGAGVYRDGTFADIEAFTAPNFLFDQWTGDGITDPSAAATSVSMTSDRLVTAFFVDDPAVIDYPEWVQLAFGPVAGDPVRTAPDYDFDDDQLSNLFEFAAGSDPILPDFQAGWPVLSLNEQGLWTFSYNRRTNGVGYVAYIQLSGDPSSGWTAYQPDPADVTVVQVGNAVERVSVILRLTLDQSRFLRYVVVSTAP